MRTTAISDQVAGAGTAGGNTPAVSVTALNKEFTRADGSPVCAIDNTTLTVDRGEFVVLLGPSGCGKTTLLRSLAGLARPDSGTIVLGGQTVYSSDTGIFAPPQARPLSMIFQSYALWPHLTAGRNVAYPLETKRPRIPRSRIAERVEEVLELVGVGDLADQHPGQMSGGQQQRVALARALVGGEQLVLFDEPLSNVDAKVRNQLREEMRAMQHRIGFAAVYVTHDQAEAMQLADRIAVIGHGKLLQFDTPRATYEHPRTRYVANFVGSTVELEGRITTVSPAGIVTTKLGDVHATNVRKDISPGDEVVAIWRPERASLLQRESSDRHGWAATVEDVSYAGTHLEVGVRVNGISMSVRTPTTDRWQPGDEGHLAVSEDDISILPIE